MTPEEARELLQILDLIDESALNPPVDVLTLKSVVTRIIRALVNP